MSDQKEKSEKKGTIMATQASITWGMFKRNRFGVVGLGIVVTIVILALAAPYIAPFDPYEIDIPKRFLPPSSQHLFGTDELGRDIFTRILYGSKLSVAMGIAAIAIAIVGGVILGLLSGYFGSLIDNLIMRPMDILFAFPGILIALLIIVILGPGIMNCMIAVGIWRIPVYARVIRGEVLSIKEREYIEAARALGASHLRVIFGEIFPNCLASIIVLSTLHIPAALLSASALSFLGLGAQPPTAEWGAMLSGGRQFLVTAPWIAIVPGLAILVTVLGFNLLGDALRDALDPRLRI